MKIEVHIDPKARTTGEIAKVELQAVELLEPFTLDINLTALLNRSTVVPRRAMDFLFAASVIYGVDKMVKRTAHADDHWTRDLSVEIPVAEPEKWDGIDSKLSECVSFLTGDIWEITFAAAGRTANQRDLRKRRKNLIPLRGDAVSLFSGGLDSFIGAIDWLSDNPDGRLQLVGHHDRAVNGPMSDQSRLFNELKTQFPGRVDLVQSRTGIHEKGPEISFRSRSLVFLALGFYVAERIGPSVPVVVPENGPIALNPPLTPSRRGSCSTRTAHPHFLAAIQEVLNAVGFTHEISNPYTFKTKGEMVTGCKSLPLLRHTYRQTVSCAKSGHTRHWDNPRAGACGRCVPCLLRRASLHAAGLDDQPYGYDVVSSSIKHDELAEDFLALLAFLKRDPNAHEIAQMLMTNGPVPIEDIADYIDLIRRLCAEVRVWLSAKAPQFIKTLAGIHV